MPLPQPSNSRSRPSTAAGAFPRHSMAPNRLSTATGSIKPRQHAHLQSQLAQLQANLADTENLLRMTAVQANFIAELGGWTGGLFMAASKVLGEETAAAASAAAAHQYQYQAQYQAQVQRDQQEHEQEQEHEQHLTEDEQ
ncbi:hypothetical protein L228DRAFT_240607 [Xylona heveae TC161]|uniref:DASH complex subunit Hsk3 like-domain-containing protein n=1 Tax=Xylona heveae (strain CBS 132557 / TC161) TaxID=1328760 RepID=A0A165FE86_XYLHT|nr:hypothetical protein L228DRAFT_240607 [Xylona heveae TC161]KZF20879.1 hypothetical protein L228DRAFT_240607 [Xylona heveae TC161]